ncbi:MAG: sigma-54-dependent Fis family transcriptional regulator [Planctomycetes bacterium]|nr:sigma-54-dependent Fis family transcriptional regulator [Planctomycetota bacterium]
MVQAADRPLRGKLHEIVVPPHARGYEVVCAARAARAIRHLKGQNIHLVLLDIRLPDASGLQLLASIHELDEEIPVIMLTAFPEVKTAVQAMRKGPCDFIVKPFELEELHLAVGRAFEARELRRKVLRFEYERQTRCDRTEILGQSPAITEVLEQIRKVAPSEMPVLVCGETGTGKELVADSIHCLSPRSSRPFVTANCSAFSEQLLENAHNKTEFDPKLHFRPVSSPGLP